MRIRLALPVALLMVSATLAMLSLTHGQDRPTTPVTPPTKSPRDLSKLKPLERQLYSAARRGAGWLDLMNGKNGRFTPGWQPALNTPLEGDSALNQAGAAFALARAARYLDDEGFAARASQAVLTLLAETTLSQDRSYLYPKQPSTVVNRVSAAALIVLAIHELPQPREELLTAAEQLCRFLQLQQQPDGSLRLCEAVAGGTPLNLEAECIARYSGQALCALTRSNERKPAAWKLAAVRKAMPAYVKWWHDHKVRDFACWHSAAYADAYLATKEKPFADAVLELNDWVCTLQHERLDPQHPQWLGGFQNVVDGKAVSGAPDVGSALCCESLAEACRVTRETADVPHHERYSAALERGLQFLATLQYTEADTQHFADWYRNRVLIGGFHASHADGNLRIDHNQHAVSALVQYLRHVVQVQ